MPRRLPAIRRLNDELRGVTIGRRGTVEASMAYLVSQRAELSRWQDIEDLVLDAFGDTPSAASRPLAHHLLVVRQVLARELHSRQIFVGSSVLDDLLFFSVADTSNDDPLLATLEFLRDRRVNRPGLVLMPLHGFGILAAGIVHAVSNRRIEVLRPQWQLAATPQTNSMRKTVEWLERARVALGVRKPVPVDSLLHYRRSRARWLEVNPLLLVPVVNVSYLPFENQRLLMSRVRAATGMLALAAAHQPAADGDPVRLFSSSRTNNFETLDIHHYVVMSDHPAVTAHLDSQVVPINVDREDVLELTDLSIQLDPRARHTRRRSFARVEAAVSVVYEGWLRHAYSRDDGGARGRVHRKAFESLNYFRRSFRMGGGRWSVIVSLAIAFELLLTDSSGRGMTEQIVRRTGLVLHGVRGRGVHQAAVRELFRARGDIVHAGTVAALDLREAQLAYAEVFGRLALRLPEVQTGWSEPLRRLTGDPGSGEEREADED
jgi:hypothetical protein